MSNISYTKINSSNDINNNDISYFFAGILLVTARGEAELTDKEAGKLNDWMGDCLGKHGNPDRPIVMEFIYNDHIDVARDETLREIMEEDDHFSKLPDKWWEVMKIYFFKTGFESSSFYFYAIFHKKS